MRVLKNYSCLMNKGNQMNNRWFNISSLIRQYRTSNVLYSTVLSHNTQYLGTSTNDSDEIKNKTNVRFLNWDFLTNSHIL